MKPCNIPDFEIAVEKLDFLLQGDFHRSGILERQPEEVAESRDHPAGGFRVFA